MFMFFDFRNYFRMLRLAIREKDRRGRRMARFMMLLVVPFMAPIHAFFCFLDYIFFPRLWRSKLKEPVFIIGHARSGTTLMHRLMTKDPNRYSYFLAYEMFFPSLIEKKILRLLGRIDRKLLSDRFHKKLTAREDKVFEKTRDVHYTGIYSPEEDDFVLTFSCASGMWIVLFPYMDQLDFYHLDEWPKKRRQKWMGGYRQFLRRQLLLNGRGKTHLSKNPTFNGRVEALIEAFPDARFVVMARDPRESIPSLLKMLKDSWRRMGWKDERTEESLQILAQQSIHSYWYPFKALESHPQTKWTVVDYRELVGSPKQTVEAVYEKLGLEMTPEYAAILEEEENRTRKHKTEHRYTLDEFGIDANDLRDELAELFDQFGWENQTPMPAGETIG